MAKVKTVKGLAGLIKKHPNAVFTVDNDWWEMARDHSENNPYDGDSDDEAELSRYEKWEEKNRLCSSDDIESWGGGYGSGSSYGGDILQALALIVGVTVESV